YLRLAAVCVSASRSSECAHRLGEEPDAVGITRGRNVVVETRRQAVQQVRAWGAGDRLGTRQRPADLCDAIRREALPALELVDVGPRESERRRPDVLRLALRVQVIETHRVRGVDLVLREERARHELED